MDIVLRPHQSYAAAYLDDVVIHSERWEDHLDRLRRVLMELRRAGLTANPRKCHLGLSEAKYLGFQVGRGLIKPQEQKVEAVQSSPKPSTKSQVRAFLGLAGYYRCFIPNSSSLAAPPDRPDQEGAAREGVLDTRGRGGPEKGEDGALLGASSASPQLQLPLSAANGCLRHRTGSRSVPSSGRWRASHPVHQQKADPGRKELRHRGEGSSGHQVGGPGAALLPPGPEVHPRYGPRTPPMDGPGEGHKHQGDTMVPRAPGLPLWGATSGRSGPLQRGRPLPDLVSFRRSVGGHSPPTPSITPTNTILFRQARTTLRGGGSVTSVPSPYQRCPGNARGAPVHSSSRADRPHLRLVSLPALKQRAHGDKARSLSMRQKPNSLSFFRSRQQCVTDQHHHEHRTDSPAPGYDREHCHKPVRHHHPRPWARINKIHPPGFLIWALLVACSFPPRYSMFTEQIQHHFNYCMSGTSLEIEVNLRTALCAIYMFASIFYRLLIIIFKNK